MLIWHITGTRSGADPAMAAAILSFGVIGSTALWRIAPLPAPVKGRALHFAARTLSSPKR
jgi:hypothetical protein